MNIIVMTCSECNLNCVYCHVMGSRRSVMKMDKQTIENLIKNCSDGYDSIKFTWHGGEPLLVGMDFYKDVIHFQKKEKKKREVIFHNTIQTNGMLLNSEWLDFFKENDFKIGISLDAPLDIFKIHRKEDPDKLLLVCEEIKKKKFSLGTLCVISNLNVGKGREIFEFFKSIGVTSFGLLPLKNTLDTNDFMMPKNDELSKMYRTIFDLWAYSENSFSCIEPFDTMLRLLLGDSVGGCSFTGSCLNKMITIDQEGNVVPCSSLVAKRFILGNIFKEQLVNIMKKPKVQKFKNMRENHIRTHCKGCSFIEICNGGCRADAYWHSKRYDGDYPYCEARQVTFEYIKSFLGRIKN
jgi:uncharacterized protein